MSKEAQMIIVGFIFGFAIGILLMMLVNMDKEIIEIERDVVPIFLIQENINTCEDLIEWMNWDVEDYADSTVFDSYIYNLEDMIESNRNILQSKYK